MLAGQFAHLVDSNELQNNSIICLSDFMHNTVQEKSVIIILRMDILDSHVGTRIGNPVDIASVVAPPTAAAAHAASAAASHEPLYRPLHNSTNNGGSPEDNTNRKSSPSSPNPYRQRPASAAPIVRSSNSIHTNAEVGITPIASLNMYSNRWTIKGRITAKSDVRTWSNAKGEGSLFSIDILDASGMDIRATFFRDAVDKFFGLLQVGQVYRFTGGRLKVANMQWNSCKSNMEISFDQNAEIHLDNDAGDIARQAYNFIRIAQVEAVEAGKNVDILAIVKQVSEPVNLISKKSGQELVKCDLTIVDDSGVEITMTLWGDKARQAPFEYGNTPVVAFRRARVSDYGGKSLSGGDSIEVNPDINEAQSLQQWWQTTGSTGASSRSLSVAAGGAGRVESLAERKTIAAIKDESMGHGFGKPDWITFKGTITFIKKDREGGAWYLACPNAEEPCKNRYKVTPTAEQQYQCEKCGGVFPNCVRRWIFSATVEDDSGSTWVSFFNEQAEMLLGATADEVNAKAYGDGYDQDAYESVFADAVLSEWIFKCKVKNELVNDESRVKTSVYALQPVDYLRESRDMLAEIEKF